MWQDPWDGWSGALEKQRIEQENQRRIREAQQANDASTQWPGSSGQSSSAQGGGCLGILILAGIGGIAFLIGGVPAVLVSIIGLIVLGLVLSFLGAVLSIILPLFYILYCLLAGIFLALRFVVLKTIEIIRSCIARMHGES